MTRGVVLGLAVALIWIAAVRGPDLPVTGAFRLTMHALGWGAVALFVGVAAYVARRRRGSAGPGRASRWLDVHEILGVLLVVTVAAHASLGSKAGLSTIEWSHGTVAAVAVLAAVLTGLLGSALYAVAPARLARMGRSVGGQIEALRAAVERLRDGRSKAFLRATDSKRHLLPPKGDPEAGASPPAGNTTADSEQVRGTSEPSAEASEPDEPDSANAEPPPAADSDQDQRDVEIVRRLQDEIRAAEARAVSQGSLAPAFRGFTVAHVVTSVAAVWFILVHVADVEWRPMTPPPGAARDLPTSQECAACHADVVAEWELSPHSRAGSSGLTLAMNQAADHAAGGQLGDTCMGCHAPLAASSANRAPGIPIVDDPAVAELAADGVSCVVCHGVPRGQSLPRSHGVPRGHGAAAVDAGSLEPNLPVPVPDAMAGPFGSGTAADPEPVRNPYHRSVFDPHGGASELCAACHNVSIRRPDAGGGERLVRLQTTYDEWLASPSAAAGRGCVDCHMPQKASSFAGTDPSLAGTGEAPVRSRVDHRFAGPDTPFWDRVVDGTPVAGTAADRADQAHSAAAALLRGAAQLELALPDRATVGTLMPVEVTIVNTGGGHDFPTGFVFEREVWLEVTARDASGRVIFESGHRDPEGRLYDELNPTVQSGADAYDAYLVNLRGRMVAVPEPPPAWIRSDGSLQIPTDALTARVNRNGTVVLGGADYPAPAPAADDRTVRIFETFLQTHADAVVSQGITAQGRRRATYPVPIRSPGTVQVSVRLLYRPMPPTVVDQHLGRPDLAARLPVFELAAIADEVPVAVPR